MRKELDIYWMEALSGKTTNEMLKTFMSKLHTAVDKHVPLSRTKTSKGDIKLSKETMKSIKRKHRMWERYMEKKSKESYREFCKARNKVKRLTRKERREKEREIAETAKTNSKNFWKYVNLKRKSKSGISELHIMKDNEKFIASCDEDKAEALAEFCSSVFTIEDDKPIPILEDLGLTGTSSDDPFSVEEVRKLLMKLNASKSPGPDSVHPRLLLELASVVDKPLCIIFNESFATGIVPDEWKIAVITALYKKGDKKSPSNYRPVSLTSILCKIMEKLIRQRITDHMNHFNLFSTQQFGFMGGRSTSLQLLNVVEKWTQILDEGGNFIQFTWTL